AIGKPFNMLVENGLDIADLRKKVKEKKSNAFQDVDADRLSAWRSKQQKLLANPTEQLINPLGAIDLSDKGHANNLLPVSLVASLNLNNCKIVLV
ncbi:hypothetical protein C0991_001822, partial [Blastosporella zonata]